LVSRRPSVTGQGEAAPPPWLPFVAGGPGDVLECLSPADWQSALDAASRGGILAPLAARLLATGAVALLPPALQEEVAEVERRTAVMILSTQRAFVRVARAFSGAGLPVVPRKGIDLAYHAYPDPRMRPMNDVDLWVREADLPAAMAALAAEGMYEKPSPYRVARFPRAWDGEVLLQLPDGRDAAAELHMGPFRGEWQHRAARIDRSAVWERLRPGTLLGYPVLRLASEDHALEVALHATVNHQLSLTPLRQLLDLALLSRAGLDHGALVERAASWRVKRAVGLAFVLAGAFFDDTPMAATGARLFPVAARQPGRTSWGLPDAGSLLRGDRLSRRQLARFAYQVRITDDAIGLARLAGRGLWPESDWLRSRYGVDGPLARARHLAWLASGRRGAQDG
jgi:hypothetical protein